MLTDAWQQRWNHLWKNNKCLDFPASAVPLQGLLIIDRLPVPSWLLTDFFWHSSPLLQSATGLSSQVRKKFISHSLKSWQKGIIKGLAQSRRGFIQVITFAQLSVTRIRFFSHWPSQVSSRTLSCSRRHNKCGCFFLQVSEAIYQPLAYFISIWLLAGANFVSWMWLIVSSCFPQQHT